MIVAAADCFLYPCFTEDTSSSIFVTVAQAPLFTSSLGESQSPTEGLGQVSQATRDQPIRDGHTVLADTDTWEGCELCEPASKSQNMKIM